MSLETWNWRYPVELQDVPWDCSAASLAWALNAGGYPTTEAEVVTGLGYGRISPQYGLLDASGAGLVSYLAELGITGWYLDPLPWGDLVNLAGHNPMTIGGRSWCHWSGCRVSGATWGRSDIDLCLLANPAPGWMQVNQSLSRQQFDELGPFSGVWFLPLGA